MQPDLEYINYSIITSMAVLYKLSMNPTECSSYTREPTPIAPPSGSVHVMTQLLYEAQQTTCKTHTQCHTLTHTCACTLHCIHIYPNITKTHTPNTPLITCPPSPPHNTHTHTHTHSTLAHSQYAHTGTLKI
jgi:hypothetical protein